MQKAKINFNTVGRSWFATDPTAARMLLNKVTPMLIDTNLIAHVWNYINAYFGTDMEENNKRILFAGCVYKMFSPGSLLPAKAVNAPAGVRAEMAKVLGYVNGSNINSWKKIATVYVKNPKYNEAKLNIVIDHFKPYSVNPADWELQLN